MWPDATDPNTAGDWGPPLWSDPTGNTSTNGPQVQANDVLTQSTVSQGQDRWSGLLTNIVGSWSNMELAKQAAANGLRPAVAPNGMPIYNASGAAYVPAKPQGNVLALVAIVGAVVLLAKHAG